MSGRYITTGSYFRTGITVSALLHIGIFYLVYFVFGSMEEEIEYVQAELWSGEYADTVQNQDDVTSQRNENTVPNNATNRSQRQTIADARIKGDEIGLDKERKEKLAKEKLEKERKEKLAKEKAEKERKEKLAKEKAEKERIIAQQRNEEVKRLKNALAGMNLNEVPKDGNNDKTIAGVEGGSEDGKRVGQLADYNEQISSKIRRKIIFDYKKVTGNPKVVFTVTSVNGSLKRIILKESSGNLKWDNAVRDAIQRSVPLPEPSDAYYAARAKKDGLTLTFRPRDRN